MGSFPGQRGLPTVLVPGLLSPLVVPVTVFSGWTPTPTLLLATRGGKRGENEKPVGPGRVSDRGSRHLKFLRTEEGQPDGTGSVGWDDEGESSECRPTQKGP